jgi:hypothetical protein
VHTCGTATTRARGWRWMDNDMVNLSCSLMGALVTGLLWKLLAGL